MPTDLEARVKELEAKVQELTDREAIRDLRYRYHEYVNEGKFAQIPSLFTDDGELDFAHLGKAKGPEELKRFFGALNEPRPEAGNRPRITWVKQFIHNHIVHLNGDTGDGFAYLEAKRTSSSGHAGTANIESALNCSTPYSPRFTKAVRAPILRIARPALTRLCSPVSSRASSSLTVRI